MVKGWLAGPLNDRLSTPFTPVLFVTVRDRSVLQDCPRANLNLKSQSLVLIFNQKRISIVLRGILPKCDRRHGACYRRRQFKYAVFLAVHDACSLFNG